MLSAPRYRNLTHEKCLAGESLKRFTDSTDYGVFIAQNILGNWKGRLVLRANEGDPNGGSDASACSPFYDRHTALVIRF